MRIAYVCADPGVPVFGCKGCSIHVQEIVRAMAARGAEVHLFANRLGGPVPRGLDKVTIHPLGALLATEPVDREREAYEANATLWRLLEEQPPFDMLYERYSLWSHAGMDFAAHARIPSILEVNAPLVLEQQKHRGIYHMELAEQIAARCFAQATSIIAVSHTVAEYVRGVAPGNERIAVIPNGVDPKRFDRCEPGLGVDGAFTVGFVGTLKPWHGVDHLIDAFAMLAANVEQVKLLIVGDGPEAEVLRQRAADLGSQIADSIEWAGALPPDQIPAFIERMDVAVAPYPSLDNFYFSPLKLLEYMAAGRAIVASRLGQIAELIEHQTNGLLVTPGCAGELHDALERLRCDPALAARLGRSAQQTILTGYTWDHVLDAVLATLEPAMELPLR